MKKCKDIKCANCGTAGRWQFANNMIDIICSYCKEPLNKCSPVSRKVKNSIMEALEIAISDMQDMFITTQDGAEGCSLCRLVDSPLCAAVRGEPTPERCFAALKKQYMALGIRDSLSKENKNGTTNTNHK